MYVRVMLIFAIVLALLAMVTDAKGARKQRQNNVLKQRTVDNNNNNKCKAVRKSCQPRNTYVEIESGDLNKFVHHVVQIKRCSGICIGFKRCLPTKIVNTTMTLKGKGNCQTITIVEHEACKCDCKIKPKDCLPPHTYRRDICNCGCSEDFIRDCNKDNNKTANREKCTCECNNKKECTTGTTWSSDECRCKLQQ